MRDRDKTFGKIEGLQDKSQSPSKGCQLPPLVCEPHSQNMFISKSMQVCLEAPAPKHHPVTQHFKKIPGQHHGTGCQYGVFFFSLLNPDQQPSYCRKGEQFGTYKLKVPVTKS